MENDIVYFENNEVNQHFLYWLKNYPLSFHPLDINRWNSFVLSALGNQEVVDYSILRKGFHDFNHHDEDDRYIDIYMNNYSSMKDLYNLLSMENKLK